jgi:O-methyltransferase involved in polyketide biosynthesis
VSSPPESLPELDGVARTALWSLHGRAAFARRGEIEDPVAVQIADALGPRLRRELGAPERSFAVRARCFDDELQRFLRQHPGARVVSLGEGLETQRHRVRGYGRWTTVDLADVIDVRERFIAPDEVHHHWRGSATDAGWLDALGTGPAFVVAQGLFMYLVPSEVGQVVRALDARSRVRLMFDVVPPWVRALSRLRPPLGRALTLPVMGWGVRGAALRRELSRWLGREIEPDLHLHRIPLPGGPTRLGVGTVAAVMDL